MNLKKKIRIIIGSLNVGGTEKQLVQILNNLSEKRWNFEIITLKKEGKLKKFLNKKIKIKSLEVNKFPKIISLLIYVYKLYKIFKKNPKTTTHFYLPEAYIIGMIASIIANSKCKLIMSRRSLNLYQNNHIFIKSIEKFLHKKVDKILVNSKAIKHQLINDENVENNKIKLIYNAVDLKKMKKEKEKLKKSDFRISIVANLIPYKCHDILFKALNLIKYKLPKNWNLCCIGRDDGLKKELLKLSKKFHIHKNITWIETFNVRNILSKSNIGVLCSNEEGFSNAILEYYASKLPVVATNVGGCKEIVKNKKNGILIPKNDEVRLSKAILFLFNNKNIAKKYGLSGFKTIKENFFIKKKVLEYEKIYKNI